MPFLFRGNQRPYYHRAPGASKYLTYQGKNTFNFFSVRYGNLESTARTTKAVETNAFQHSSKLLVDSVWSQKVSVSTDPRKRAIEGKTCYNIAKILREGKRLEKQR